MELAVSTHFLNRSLSMPARNMLCNNLALSNIRLFRHRFQTR